MVLLAAGSIRFNPSWVPPAGLINQDPKLVDGDTAGFNPSWVPPAGLIRRRCGPACRWLHCFNPSWVPPAGLMKGATIRYLGDYKFQSLMGATGRSNEMVESGELTLKDLSFNPSWVPPAGLIVELFQDGDTFTVSIPHGCHRPV